MNDHIPLLALCATLATVAVSAMVGAFKVGAIVGQWKKTLEDSAKQEAVIATIPLIVKDVEQLRKEVTYVAEQGRAVANKFHSDFPPMRERLESVSDEVDELKALRSLEPRVAVVEKLTGISNRGMPAVQAPRPRTDPRREGR